MKHLLPLLVLVCVIALCLGTGKTYAVITASTNVVVNTFYGESEEEPESSEAESQESEPSEEYTEESGTKGTETEEAQTSAAAATEAETSAAETETSAAETEETSSAGTYTGEGTDTGDGSGIIVWLIIAAAAIVGLLAIGFKTRKEKKRTDK